MKELFETDSKISSRRSIEKKMSERFQVERKLAAIVAADIVGYSRLMEVDEVGTLQSLKIIRKNYTDPLIDEYGGKIVKTTGDGLLVDFLSIVDAVSCAIEIQRSISKFSSSLPDDKRLIMRIGINIGDIIIEDNDIFGDGVNIAARLESLCEPGGICISEIVHEQIHNKLPHSFTNRGKQIGKNISRPIYVHALTSQDIATTEIVPPSHSSARRERSNYETRNIQSINTENEKDKDVFKKSGGYTKFQADKFVGSYVTFRPSFSDDGTIFVYLTDIAWNSESNILEFCEKSRSDAEHSQSGYISIPQETHYIYFVVNAIGQYRLTISRRDAISGEIHGLINTLKSTSNDSLVPTSTYIYMVPSQQCPHMITGIIKEGDEGYSYFKDKLNKVKSKKLVEMITI